MLMKCTLEDIAVGGNRHSSAADWASDLLAFGAGNNIALWNPNDPGRKGVTALLSGHTDVVNAVKIFENGSRRLIISGGADATVRIWRSLDDEGLTGFSQEQCLTEHTSSINALAVLPQLELLVSSSADGTLKVWQLQNATAKLVQSISLKPRFLPLALAITSLSSDVVVIAAAGTSNVIQLFVRSPSIGLFEFQASLTGHEGWIRCLDFTLESQAPDSDVLLASASQDKYIRLWRFRKIREQTRGESDLVSDFAAVSERKSLSNKAHQVGSPESRFNVTFEALLIGHEDWIYTVRWEPADYAKVGPGLLSASADNSLAIWHADSASGLWMCDSRLGEISSQKGSTTATGSAGGFWIGLWHPQGRSVVSLGRTGSWRMWTYDASKDMWAQQAGISGHVQEVLGLAWSPQGDYLLTTSSDQTTRLRAEWVRPGATSWHELSRPQIHGYDLNCIDIITDTRFISGADEKLLRVFDIPKAVNMLLSGLGCHVAESSENLPEAANIPVLGLSNKATSLEDEDDNVNSMANGHGDEQEIVKPDMSNNKSAFNLDQPPLEDVLARHTLWPEHEKLYGHGYEISTVATSHDGTLVATACKASSIDHAVIRLYDTREWREVRPALKAHNLTVTRLSFSPDDQYLLSVARDRQWALFKRSESDSHAYTLQQVNPKGHSRMILDCSWAPLLPDYVFATAGRDKVVKIWKLTDGGVSHMCLTSVTAGISVTALAWQNTIHGDTTALAYGTEDGRIVLVSLDLQTFEIKAQEPLAVAITPSKNINTLRWRPYRSTSANAGVEAKHQLACASDDYSVRLYNVS